MSKLQSLGKYQIECELGSGAMGVVYKAFDPSTSQYVAIKTIHRSFLNTDLGNEVLVRFQKEAEANVYLQHPNIVKTLSTSCNDDIHYKVMEFVEGKDLKALLTEKITFSVEHIIEIIDALLSAVTCAHEEGIVHGHIKPANILVTHTGKVKITDFGMIRTDNASSTIASTILATMFYMSPEQCKGEKIDARSDLFSIGTVLYELLASQKPFRGDHSAIIMANIINAEPEPPSRINQDIPSDFDHIIRKALEKESARRYQSAREFRKDLLAINTKATRSAPPDARQNFGKYRIEGVLGEGAMGVVYKAFDPGLDRYVAIKAIRKHLLNTDMGQAMFARFRNEAKLASRLAHPNIVAIYEFDQDNGTPYFVMEYVEGVDLHTALKKGKIFTLEDILPIIDAVLLGLSYTHEFGIVHRDIKPANIFISKKGEVKVSDFSIARQENSDLTEVGTVIGTPSYMSPEQCTGSDVDGRSDIFSVGVMLYELLTDQKPFEGENYSSIMYKVVNIVPPRPSLINHQLPKGLDVIIEKALAKNPADRFTTADDFRQALNQLSFDEPQKPKPRSFIPKALASALAGLALFGSFVAYKSYEDGLEKHGNAVRSVVVKAPTQAETKNVEAKKADNQTAFQSSVSAVGQADKPKTALRVEPVISKMITPPAAFTPPPLVKTTAVPGKPTVLIPPAILTKPTVLAESAVPTKPTSPVTLTKKTDTISTGEKIAPKLVASQSSLPVKATVVLEPQTFSVDNVINEAKTALNRGQRDKAISLLEGTLQRPGLDESTKRVISVRLLSAYEDAIEDALAIRSVHSAQEVVSKMRLLAVSSSIVASYEQRILMLDIDIEAKKEAARERAAKEAERAEAKRRQLLSQEPTDEMLIY